MQTGTLPRLLSLGVVFMVPGCAPGGGNGDSGSPTGPTITYVLRIEPSPVTVTTREGSQLSVVSTPEAPSGTFWGWTSSNNQVVIIANPTERDTRVLCNNTGSATVTVSAVSIRDEPSATATVTCAVPPR